MKSKTTTAVLLSLLAVAGLAVNDAYAQSNTERLVSIDENAESIKGTVEGIADDTDVLSTMVSAIQDTLSGMADTLTGIMNAITGVQTSVDGVAADVTQINSKIVGIETTLASLSGLDARLASIDDRINSLASSGMNDQILQVLTSTVTNTNDRLEQVINRLDAIQAGLENANIKISEIETAPTTSPTREHPAFGRVGAERQLVPLQSIRRRYHEQRISLLRAGNVILMQQRRVYRDGGVVLGSDYQ